MLTLHDLQDNLEQLEKAYRTGDEESVFAIVDVLAKEDVAKGLELYISDMDVASPEEMAIRKRIALEQAAECKYRRLEAEFQRTQLEARITREVLAEVDDNGKPKYTNDMARRAEVDARMSEYGFTVLRAVWQAKQEEEMYLAEAEYWKDRLNIYLADRGHDDED